MIFSDRNIGREIILAKSKQLETISYILKNKKAFRVESEVNGAVVSDYTLTDIAEADCLTVSYDDGKTWQDIAIRYNKEDSLEEYEATEKVKDKKV